MKDRYTRLKLKMVLQIAGVVLLAALLGVIFLYTMVDGALQAPFADAFISFCKFFGMDYDGALQFYHEVIRRNKTFWLAFGFLLLLALAVYLAMSRISRYMNQISEAADEVLKKTDALIRLPTELRPMEIKLNTIKTTLRRREYEAKEAEQRKNDLVVYLAHDLKTPLTSVIGYLNLLNDEKEISPELRDKYTHISLEKAERLEELINEFFEITRFNLQNIELERTHVNLTHFLAQLTEEFYPQFSEKALSCRLDVQPDLAVWGDADKLARVFDNLLRNAINYGAEGTEIAVLAFRREDQVVLQFRNAGAQIPEQQLQRIFDKFYRADASRSSRTGGAGLGLAIAKEITELHGGTISAFSNEQFTTFQVVLPAAERPVEERKEMEA
ncbi:HAMP domain-containing sensor histidine kinase [Clostridium sp. D33t1_170424_F3]|uniref:sensor histidine kinase n=1 Tax=Clostridium sp. D33t1_170424_F3 TaxID=2787099 RepID=UPI0018A9CA0D|nr:HAMP domain-containing sensor histidine kinase [Clostridium sp. D33t1_170424_F3]